MPQTSQLVSRRFIAYKCQQEGIPAPNRTVFSQHDHTKLRGLGIFFLFVLANFPPTLTTENGPSIFSFFFMLVADFSPTLTAEKTVLQVKRDRSPQRSGCSSARRTFRMRLMAMCPRLVKQKLRGQPTQMRGGVSRLPKKACMQLFFSAALDGLELWTKSSLNSPDRILSTVVLRSKPQQEIELLHRNCLQGVNTTERFQQTGATKTLLMCSQL